LKTGRLFFAKSSTMGELYPLPKPIIQVISVDLEHVDLTRVGVGRG